MGKMLRRLFILLRRKNDWSPLVIALESWRLLANFGTHLKILRVLKLRPFDEIAQSNPGLAFKYVVPNYLSRSFTVSERASCFLYHYRRMHGALPECMLGQILRGDVTLHEVAKDGDRFAYTIGPPEPNARLEGELDLALRVDDKKIFNLSFIIVPGWVVKSEAAEILLITRLQGAAGCSSEINRVCKLVYDYSPRSVLLSALQGIAEAFGITEIEAVSAKMQRCYSKERSAIFMNGYDDFFTTVGMVKTAFGFYSTSIPIESKPLASIKGNNRSRAKKRRVMTQKIRLACAGFFLGAAERAADQSSWATNSFPDREAVELRPARSLAPQRTSI
jgi:hypothetical protein